MRQQDGELFISYATVDDGHGWVTEFVKHLSIALDMRLGKRSPECIWWDNKDMDRDAPLTEQIQRRAEEAKMMIALLSPGYVHSRWCTEERRVFLQTHPDAMADRRLVLIDLGTLPLRDRPAELSDLLGHRFYDPKNLKRLGHPKPSLDDGEHRNFFAAIDDLAGSLAERLKGDGLTSTPGSIRIPHDRVRVFVAQSTDDIADQRDQVVRYLADHFTVIPAADEGFAGRWNDWQTQVDRAIADCDWYVQLIGESVGARIAGSEKRPVTEQYARAKLAGKRRLLWRAPGDRSAIADEAFGEVVSAAEYCGTIQAFCEAIVQAATPESAGPKSSGTHVNGSHQASEVHSVFIQAGIEDVARAAELSTVLNDLHCFTQLPLHEGTPQEIRADLEENLDSCDGLIVLYGRIPTTWLRAQFRELPRHLARRLNTPHSRPIPALAVFRCESGSNCNPGVSGHGLQWIDESDPDARRKLQEWVASIRQGGGS